MRVNGKEYFDDATITRAADLIEAAELSLSAICKELHTSLPVLTRSMNLHFRISKDEPNWREIHKAKRLILKRKKNVRVVWECQSCSYEAKIKFERCAKCGSNSVEKRELRNKIRPDEMRAIKKIGCEWSKDHE